MRAVLQGSSRALLGSTLSPAPFGARATQMVSRRLIVAEGERQQQGEASTSQAPPAPPAQPSVRVPPQSRPPPPSPYGDNLEIKRVEQRGDSRFSGTVALDRGETPNDWGRVALLVGGDVAALLLFAAIGRASHGEPLSLGAAFGTAWPFIAGWFASAYVLDGYGKAAQGGSTGAAAATAAKTWALGIPAGQLIRAASRGYLPDPAFVAVSMAATGVFLVGWRSALAAATPEVQQPRTPLEQLRARKNRQGNPFEMLSMVMSLIKRW